MVCGIRAWKELRCGESHNGADAEHDDDNDGVHLELRLHWQHHSDMRR